jgi:hypothetical protein
MPSVQVLLLPTISDGPVSAPGQAQWAAGGEIAWEDGSDRSWE